MEEPEFLQNRSNTAIWLVELIKKLNPALGKKWHYLANVVLWIGLGIMLVSIASRWLQGWDLLTNGLILGGGLIFGFIFYRFGFSRMAAKNIRRIEAKPGVKHCIFGFHGWKLYPIVLIMILTFVALRENELVPLQILAVLYFAIGFSKFASSMVYIRKLISNK